MFRFKAALKENRPYKGTIRDYQIKDGRFIVFVELNDEPGVQYLNSLRLDPHEDTPFYEFCEKMNLIDESGGVDFDILLDEPVKVQFKKAKSGDLFICTLEPNKEQEKDEIEEDEVKV